MKIKGFRRNVEQEFGEHARRCGAPERLQARGAQMTQRKSLQHPCVIPSIARNLILIAYQN